MSKSQPLILMDVLRVWLAQVTMQKPTIWCIVMWTRWCTRVCTTRKVGQNHLMSGCIEGPITIFDGPKMPRSKAHVLVWTSNSRAPFSTSNNIKSCSSVNGARPSRLHTETDESKFMRCKNFEIRKKRLAFMSEKCPCIENEFVWKFSLVSNYCTCFVCWSK